MRAGAACLVLLSLVACSSATVTGPDGGGGGSLDAAARADAREVQADARAIEDATTSAADAATPADATTPVADATTPAGDAAAPAADAATPAGDAATPAADATTPADDAATPLDSGTPDAAPAPVCGDGLTEAPEVCDPATDGCCDATCTGPAPLDTVCRAARGTCDPAERCDGVRTTCGADQTLPDLTACTGCTGTSSTTCLGCWAGACAPYVSPCLAILQRGQSVGDGIYTIPAVETGTTALSVLCDMTTDGGGWTLLYKKSARVPGNAFGLWTGGATHAADLTLLDRGRDPRDYVSPLIETIWPAFTEARVEVITGTVAAKAIQLDTIGSDTLDWFAPQRVTQSSWTDLPTSPTWQNNNGRYFSIQGTTGRTWYVNATWGGCPADTGWLMITHATFCTWEGRSPDAPSEILYAAGNTVASIPNTNATRRADALMVWLR